MKQPPHKKESLPNEVGSPSNNPSATGKIFPVIHPIVFWGTAGFIGIFVTLCLLNITRMNEVFATMQAFISETAGWIYILSVNIFLGFCLFLLVSRLGSIRLGGSTAEPEFSYFGWLAMLFSAGMGIGLVFYSVAEPISHFTNPPFGPPYTTEAAQSAMSITLLHWGLHCCFHYNIIYKQIFVFSICGSGICRQSFKTRSSCFTVYTVVWCSTIFGV